MIPISDLTDAQLRLRLNGSGILQRYEGLKEVVEELWKRYEDLKKSAEDYSEI